MAYWTDFHAFHCVVYFCCSEKSYRHTMKKLNVKNVDVFLHDGGDATTHLLALNGVTAVVCCPCLKADRKTNALLCHEAVHVWQEIKRCLQEEKPGDEIEAYAIQSIADFLMWALQQEIKKRRTK